MYKFILTVIVAVFLIVIAPANLFAHDEIHTFQNVDGKNILIVYYNLEQFSVGIPNTFAIKFYQLADGQPIDFSVANVKIIDDNQIQFATAIKNTPDQPASFSFTPKKPGQVTLEVEILQNARLLTKASFPLQIQPDKAVSFIPTIYLIPLLFFTFISAYLLGVKRIHAKIILLTTIIKKLCVNSSN